MVTEANQLSIFDNKTDTSQVKPSIVQSVTLHDALQKIKQSTYIETIEQSLVCILTPANDLNEQIFSNVLRPDVLRDNQVLKKKRILNHCVQNIFQSVSIRDTIERLGALLPLSLDDVMLQAKALSSLPWNATLEETLKELQSIETWGKVSLILNEVLGDFDRGQGTTVTEEAVEKIEALLGSSQSPDGSSDIQVVPYSDLGSLKTLAQDCIVLVLLSGDSQQSQRILSNVFNLRPSYPIIFIDPLFDSSGSERERLTSTVIAQFGLGALESFSKQNIEETAPEEFAVSKTLRSLSTSAISQYALCPYRYFAQYQLDLNAKDSATFWSLSPARLGEFMHAVFENELPAVLKGKSPSEIDLESYRGKYFDVGRFSVFHTLDLERLEKSIVTVLSHERERLAGIRNLNQVEIAFNLPIVNQRGVNNSILLRGRMDRVDVLEDGRIFIVDYKSSGMPIGPKVREQLLDLTRPQLAIYAVAAKEMNLGEPAGAVEFRIGAGKEGGLVSSSLKPIFKSASYEKIDMEDFVSSSALRIRNLVSHLQTAPLMPQPKDTEQCGLGNCRYFSLCRYNLSTEGES